MKYISFIAKSVITITSVSLPGNQSGTRPVTPGVLP
jgi:hypothetical protein